MFLALFFPLACLLAPVHWWSSETWDSCLTLVTCRDRPDGCTLWKLTPGLCKSKLNCEVKRLGPVTSSSYTGRGRGVQTDRHTVFKCTHTHSQTHRCMYTHTHRYVCVEQTHRHEHRGCHKSLLFLCMCVCLCTLVRPCASPACVHELNYNLVISAVSQITTQTHKHRLGYVYAQATGFSSCDCRKNVGYLSKQNNHLMRQAHLGISILHQPLSTSSRDHKRYRTEECASSVSKA